MYYFADLYPDMKSRATSRKTLPVELHGVADVTAAPLPANRIWTVLAVIIIVIVGIGFIGKRL